MAEKDNYIAALEKKLAELSGIEVDQIRKNQLSNAASEAKSIQDMADYVASITVQKPATALQSTVLDPQVQSVFEHIQAELGDAGKRTLPPLKYDYSGLEPHISAMIMEIHHTKHHQGYINNLIAAEEKYNQMKALGDIAGCNKMVPAIKFNGGGHLNHSIFWTNMAPNPSDTPTMPSGALLQAIEKDFTTFDAFKSQFSTASAGVKGSGWGWLGYDAPQDKLAIATCQNQDPLQLTTGLVPLLGLDVWEHAYYLQYKNLRPAYVAAFFNVVDWNNVAERYQAARKAAGH